MRIVVFGLSITSSWGNGHATTFRALTKALHAAGHSVLFAERDVPWYASHRDLPDPPFCELALYGSVGEARERFAADVRDADAVVVGSYVPDGVAIGEWATETAGGTTAFYDIDTPVTLAKLAAGDHEYLAPALIPKYDVYLSFTGGPTLTRLEREFGSPAARPLYCSVDPDLYRPDDGVPRDLDLGYLGTWSADRQPTVDRFLIETARALPERRFAVAGPQYPESIDWPANVDRTDHLPPAEHARFYNRQRFTLNVTRADMIAAGYAPSVRLFEAAACGTPVISDRWAGLDELLTPGEEILIADSPADVRRWLTEVSEEERAAIGAAARRRVLAEHTAERRAAELVAHLSERPAPPAGPSR
ncbi:glycosyltransferase [Alienimonas sp. DA493]|uniref:CgeB family protein n=1 Tax=Alienimonas sp. DA493 TaxID=3373605 RepID=UPI003754134E